ncbi:MAG: hypothetical protein ACI9EW_003190 [Cellvibrionaceae bacterium]|jgi:hypothetical protein
MRPSLKIVILRTVLILVFSILIFQIGYARYSFLAVGLLVGATLRDIVWFRQSAIGWSLLQQIIDWSVVNQLLEGVDQEQGQRK